ncbi:ABC transporter substrate-binding protein [Frondihabitans australicus]|uniref:Carbohydrate ABC transporter substrate-binding protein (CUT1 family) n=1 Tax=Frondihabitans australicus TaxID=386892 RepID=A0A495IKF7_9MICO|nr:extracellular solute-binding protein [Frondihabitans australicus]RKR76444.1 carbohydrate ABC transporter substrate-binding protein (CUT1 family) [Frondihabitans australicus]
METSTASVSRRGFLGLVGGAAAVTALAACTTGGASASGGALKFWNMPWGGPAFNPLDKKITEAYKPSGSLPKATYQAVQWANFNQVFATSVASKTNPAVSSGGGTQAFLFDKQGFIAHADDLLDSWKSNGLYDDFLPGLLDTMKTPNGYVAIPYNLDMRVLWYNKDLLDKAGATPPTDWQSYLDAAAALKKIGVYGFAANGDSSAGNAFQMITGFMINNGGGIFDEERKPNLVTQANIEALEFIKENISKGYVDPGSVSYTATNSNSEWKAGKFGMGIDVPGLAANVGGSVASQLVVGDPLVSAAGKKGALYFPNNIMMYKNTPSQKDSEAFVTYYYQHMKELWTQKTGIGLPVLKSIASTPEFQSDPNQVKIVQDWQPIAKTWAAPGNTALFANVSKVDSTPAMSVFGQNVLSGKTPKESLTTLQNTLTSQIKS